MGYMMKNEYIERAEESLKNALKMMNEILDSKTRNDDLIVEILYNLALIEKKKGRDLNIAMRKAKESYSMKEKLLGPKHPDLRRLQKLIDDIMKDQVKGTNY